MNEIMESGASDALVRKWGKVVDSIEDGYTRKVTAQLLENQLKSIQLDEAAVGTGTTTVGNIGTFQKYAFPLVRRIFPNLIANQICAVQPMSGPVSQVFYLGSNRVSNNTAQSLYSKYNITYRGQTAGRLDLTSSAVVIDSGTIDASALLDETAAHPSGTMGGGIANWPPNAANPLLGFSVSAGERLEGTSIPEMEFKIENQPVIARTRKMRALWTLEASQDLKAYHSLDLEREVTDLLGKEIRLEVDRELIEDIRAIAYDTGGQWKGFDWDALNQGQSNSFNLAPTSDSAFGSFQYDFTADTDPQGAVDPAVGNVYLIDLATTALPYAPQHTGHVYSNLLAVINFAAQSIYTTTHRGPGNWLLTSPVVAAMLESAAKLEGGLAREDGPTNISKNGISFAGKFMGRYDLFVDPLFPEGEIIVGYKGSGPMDAGYIYSPYIPFQNLATIVDPESFQPRKGIMTRYGKTAITPSSRFYRVIRIVGNSANWLTVPYATNALNNRA